MLIMFYVWFIQMMAATFRNQSLDSVSKELVEAGEKLKKVTKLGAECLMAFIECQPLVMWLKEKMKGTYAQIETFRHITRAYQYRY